MPFDQAAVRAAVLESLKRDDAARQQDTVARTMPPSRSIGPWPYAAMIAGNAADVGSTLYAKDHGAVELNPLYGDSNAGLIAGKAATTALLAFAMHALEKSGHPTAAKVLGYGAGAGFGALGAHNIAVTR